MTLEEQLLQSINQSANKTEDLHLNLFNVGADFRLFDANRKQKPNLYSCTGRWQRHLQLRSSWAERSFSSAGNFVKMICSRLIDKSINDVFCCWKNEINPKYKLSMILSKFHFVTEGYDRLSRTLGMRYCYADLPISLTSIIDVFWWFSSSVLICLFFWTKTSAKPGSAFLVLRMFVV